MVDFVSHDLSPFHSSGVCIESQFVNGWESRYMRVGVWCRQNTLSTAQTPQSTQHLQWCVLVIKAGAAVLRKATRRKNAAPHTHTHTHGEPWPCMTYYHPATRAAELSIDGRAIVSFVTFIGSDSESSEMKSGHCHSRLILLSLHNSNLISFCHTKRRTHQCRYIHTWRNDELCNFSPRDFWRPVEGN